MNNVVNKNEIRIIDIAHARILVMDIVSEIKTK
jgi:hypothetical protein